METMRSSWTDERLDDLNDRVGELSGRVDALGLRVDALSTRVDALGERLDGRIDALQHTMVQGFIVMIVAMGSGFIGLAGLIVAKL